MLVEQNVLKHRTPNIMLFFVKVGWRNTIEAEGEKHYT